MMNPGYRKTILRDEQGEVLLPQTTASMVSEEPDRRFVDRVEKSLLRALADNQVALENISEHYTNLVLLAENADEILPDPSVKEALQTIGDNVVVLSSIIQEFEQIKKLTNGEIEVLSTGGDSTYILRVDDSTSTPKLTISKKV